MGNQLYRISRTRDEKRKVSSKLSVLLKLKRKKSRNPPISDDNFIIERLQNISLNDSSISSELDVRRIVFVSVIGLYNTWRNVPSHMLYSSLLILPLRKKWVYDTSKYSGELSARLFTQSFLDKDETQEFILLLKWKDSQGLVCWMLDALNCGPGETLVASAWHNVSQKLKSLYDPVTSGNYKPLNFEANWWQKKETFISKYDAKPVSILSELYFVTMKFNTIQEIVYQSNPNSLIPIKSYGNLNVSQMTSASTPTCETIDETISNTDGHETWFISDDYDPYDMEECQIAI